MPPHTQTREEYEQHHHFTRMLLGARASRARSLHAAPQQTVQKMAPKNASVGRFLVQIAKITKKTSARPLDGDHCKTSHNCRDTPYADTPLASAAAKSALISRRVNQLSKCSTMPTVTSCSSNAVTYCLYLSWRSSHCDRGSTVKSGQVLRCCVCVQLKQREILLGWFQIKHLHEARHVRGLTYLIASEVFGGDEIRDQIALEHAVNQHNIGLAGRMITVCSSASMTGLFFSTSVSTVEI